MSKANETQVGGSHYARGGKLQHWDYAVRALGNRYLEGAITKYVMRHRHKGVGEQDLNKALHFTEKLLEEFHAGRVRPIRESRDFTFSIHEMSVVNGLNTNEDFIVKRLASWENDVQLSTSLTTAPLTVKPCGRPLMEPRWVATRVSISTRNTWFLAENT